MALLCAPLSSQADTILGLYAGVGQWQASLSGEVGENGESTTLDDLGYDKEPSNVFWAQLEHPIPLLPNIRVMATRINASSTATITKSFSLAGVDFQVSDDVASNIDLSHVDATLYYELLDNWISLDAGITARQFSGQLEARSQATGTVTGDLKGVLPMLYLNARIDLPFTGWHVGAQSNVISYRGDGVTDMNAQVGYELDLVAVDLGLNIGYRTMTLKVEELDDLYADAEVSGVYAELQIHF